MGALFPAHFRTVDDAITFLPRWAEMIGGEFLSGIETDELVDDGGAIAVVRVRPFRVLFGSSSTELTVRLVFSAELEPFAYSFDLRRKAARSCGATTATRATNANTAVRGTCTSAPTKTTG